MRYGLRPRLLVKVRGRSAAIMLGQQMREYDLLNHVDTPDAVHDRNGQVFR